MSQHTITHIVSVVLALIGLAAIAVLLSPQSKTAGVLGQSGNSLAQALSCALSPVTGGSCGGRSLIPSVNSTLRFPGVSQ